MSALARADLRRFGAVRSAARAARACAGRMPAVALHVTAGALLGLAMGSAAR